MADEYSYNYFLEHDGNLFGEPSDFDGQHGLTAYNKTDQMKVEDEDSTFFNPKFSQLLTRKPISEWIVSVGRHEGFISSRKWVETQNMLENSKKKLMKKNLDMIVANNLKEQGAGFETDTNIVTMITQNEVFELELMSKEEVAFHLLDKILELRK